MANFELSNPNCGTEKFELFEINQLGQVVALSSTIANINEQGDIEILTAFKYAQKTILYRVTTISSLVADFSFKVSVFDCKSESFTL